MAIEISQSQARTVEHYPASIPSSVAVVVRDSQGSVLGAGAATVDSVDTAVSSATDRQTLALGDVTGIVVGRKYWVVSSTNSELRDLVTVESVAVASKTASLAPAPHRLPVSGDLFVGARVSYEVGSGLTANRGTNNQIVWTVTDLDGQVSVEQTQWHCVRTVFSAPVTPADVRQYVTARYANQARRFDADPTIYQSLASRASEMVRGRIRASQRYPHLIGEPDLFREAGSLALKIALIDFGLVSPEVTSPEAYQVRLVELLDQELVRALSSATYDSNDDGATSDEETGSRLRSIRMSL